jgi:hypothetical protein
VKILKWLSLTLVLLISLAAGLLYFNQDKIIALVLQQINSNLAAPVQVEKVNVSLQKFPLAAVKMEQVFTAGNPAAQSDTLLYAQQVFLAFNLWDVFTQNIAIAQVSAESGRLNISTNSLGIHNYVVLKDDSSNSENESAPNLDLEAIQLKNMRSSYQDATLKIALTGQIEELKIEGQFLKTSASLAGQAQLKLKSYLLDNYNYLAKPISLSGDVTLNTTSQSISFKSKSLNLNEEIKLGAIYKQNKNEDWLQLTSQSLALEALLPLAQEQKWLEVSGITTRGIGEAQAKIDFRPEKTKVTVTFAGENCSLAWQQAEPLENIQFKGNYSWTEDEDILTLSEIQSDQAQNSFRGSATLSNLDYPTVNAELSANLPLQKWLDILALDTLQNGQGQLEAEISVKGRFKDLGNITRTELNVSEVAGQLTFTNGGFSFKGQSAPVTGLNGNLNLKGKTLEVNNLYFKSAESDVYLKGSFYNPLGYLFFKQENLAVDVLVKSQELRLDSFLQDKNSSEPGTYSLAFTRQLDLRLQLEVERLSLATFKAKEIKGLLKIKNGRISGEQISLKAHEGSYAGAFELNPLARQGYQLNAKLEANHINMRQLFAGFNNFNQQTITANNLVGTGFIKTQLSLNLNENLVLNPYSLNTQANLRLKNGHLKNYEPMLALSRFAEIDELQDVAFSELNNSISIQKGVITIPKMAINSSVLNLELLGTHTFENEINYLVKLKLKDILFKKDRNHQNKEFEKNLAIAKEDDDHRIPIAISGTTDNPQIRVTAKDLGQSLKTDLKKQGQELKEIFKKQPPKKKKPGIIYEWDG